MSSPNLKGNLVKSVVTRFYYKAEKLCYRILIRHGEDNNEYLKDFENYQEYQKNHDRVISAMNNGKNVPEGFILSTDSDVGAVIS